MVTASVLYEDSYCRVRKGQIEVKGYFFPFNGTKHIDLRNVKTIYVEQQSRQLGNTVLRTKDWGMTLNPVWWARDLKRTFLADESKTNVVFDTGSRILKGFTVENINEFLSYVTPALNDQTRIVNSLPY